MNDLLTRLTSVLESEPEIQLALLFGSHARATAGEDSDLDLAILGYRPLSTDFKFHLMQRLGGEFGLPVDLIDLHHTPEPVTGEALKGIRLIGADHVFAELLIRHLDNVEDFIPLQKRIFDERRARWLH